MAATDLQLPEEVRPLWIDAVFTSEFERDTLPLLFSTDRIFEEYYDALTQKNAHVSLALDQIRERNVLARRQRADGLWQECVEGLVHCVHLRRCLFEESDFQFVAAQRHCILSLVSFATFYLKKSDDPKRAVRDTMMMRAFELFKRAEDMCRDIADRNDRHFFRAYVTNNYATYFAKRGKYKAAAQRMALSLAAWTHTGLRALDVYFAVQKGAGEAWSGRFEEAIEALKTGMRFAPERSGDAGGSSGAVTDPSGDHGPSPVRFSVQLLSSSMPIMDAAYISLHYNTAVALIGLRRYKDAAPWCAEAMRLVAAQAAVLKGNSMYVKLVHNTQAFCQKMSFSTRFTEFRMKRSEYQSEQYTRIQQQASSNPGSEAFERRRRLLVEQLRQQQQQQQSSSDPAQLQAEHGEGNAARPDRTSTPRAKTSPRPPGSARTVDALRVYLNSLSYKELIQQYESNGRPKRESRSDHKAQPPSKSRPATTSDGRPPPASGNQRQAASAPSSPANHREDDSARQPDSARTASSYRSSSRTASSASSSSYSSRDHSPAAKQQPPPPENTISKTEESAPSQKEDTTVSHPAPSNETKGAKHESPAAHATTAQQPAVAPPVASGDQQRERAAITIQSAQRAKEARHEIAARKQHQQLQEQPARPVESASAVPVTAAPSSIAKDSEERTASSMAPPSSAAQEPQQQGTGEEHRKPEGATTDSKPALNTTQQEEQQRRTAAAQTIQNAQRAKEARQEISARKSQKEQQPSTSAPATSTAAPQSDAPQESRPSAPAASTTTANSGVGGTGVNESTYSSVAPTSLNDTASTWTTETPMSSPERQRAQGHVAASPASPAASSSAAPSPDKSIASRNNTTVRSAYDDDFEDED